MNNAKKRDVFSIPPKKACLLTQKGRQPFSHVSIKHECHCPGRVLQKTGLDAVRQRTMTLLLEQGGAMAVREQRSNARSPQVLCPRLSSRSALWKIFVLFKDQLKIICSVGEKPSSTMKNAFSPWDLACVC